MVSMMTIDDSVKEIVKAQKEKHKWLDEANMQLI